MLELLVRIYALLIFIAYRVVSPSSEADMQVLAEALEYLNRSDEGAPEDATQ